MYSPSVSEALLPRSPCMDGDGAGFQDPSSPWEALLLALTPGPANARKKRAGFSKQFPSSESSCQLPLQLTIPGFVLSTRDSRTTEPRGMHIPYIYRYATDLARQVQRNAL